MDVAIAQGAAFQHAELVEHEIRVVAGAVEDLDGQRHDRADTGHGAQTPRGFAFPGQASDLAVP
ncbi:MAG: hypothetical protein JJT81_12700 [Rubellimicrobium sp.]|nr:hypothetical protein [Rubellimicrobium sp.]